jgi:agmatinase
MHHVLTGLPQVERLVQFGIRSVGAAELALAEAEGDRVCCFFDHELVAERLGGGATWEDQCRRIVEALPVKVHLSFDIDGLDPTLCPGTGTPVPGGVSWGEICCLLRILAESDREIIGLDLVEVSPSREDDEWDGNVAARLLYKMIGCALRCRPGR